MIRKIVFYQNYFTDFYKDTDIRFKKKILYTFKLIKTMEQVPSKFLKHLSDGLYEIRIKHGSNAYRIFCCFDKGQVVVRFNAFQKKTQNTLKGEINKAKKIIKQYFNEKERL